MSQAPAVAVYLPEFLKLDMQHVYRQISALPTLPCHVFTHKRENEKAFPFHERRLHLLPRPRLRAWRRWVNLTLRQQPWQLFDWELRHLILELTRVEAGLLHVFFGHIAPQFRPLMRAWPRPVVVSFHGADAGIHMEKPGYRRAMQEVFELGSLMLCRSESLARDLEALGCPAAKIRLWRTGIPLEEWPFQPAPAQPEDGIMRLIQVCRFMDKKGLDLTLDAFATVLVHHPKAILHLIGDGPCLGALKEQAERLGISKSVRFPGFMVQGSVKKMVYRCHLFLHPSRTSADGNREGIPNAALEAMAAGVPVLATTHGGFPEAITSGVNGVLVPENRADLLAEAALKLLNDSTLRLSLATEARKTVEQQFDRDAQVRVLEGHYLSLLQPRA
jgi:colanic acid/amylovoran biosynthesis glycosyltransferase